MPSFHETFWTHERYAVVGHSAGKPFPRLTYGFLKERGVTVYAVDPSVTEIEGDAVYADFASLPEKVQAVVLEVPVEQTAAWVEKVADAGIEHVWIHQGRDTPEALTIGEERGLQVRHGNCAVMYVTEGFAQGHGIHRFIWKALGKY